MTGRRGKKLSAEDRTLWSHVARSVTPLDPARAADLLAEPAEDVVQKPEPAAKAVAATRIAKAALPAPPPLAPLEKRLRQRLTRGQADVDARLDLHGLTQEAAHRRLLTFLRRAQLEGFRVVIVITGKGAPKRTAAFDTADWSSDPFAGRGVLRRMVPHWLTLPEMRSLVIGFEEAAIGHGGAGALYVRIRRPAGG
ncbi:Smr/MutS family protein [Phreatobacter stygius]|uniref:DNA mismatch repair protein MutS n=1 Tax=Phreatobacter stygius TaxID=1940610 RepID=A0A4D7AU19_9HYPH|nr:Smr/MutS family protein [Phreatobacter stygius]QCI65084.1 DNA mismatch repair protein MutS [Phreatobacter stygius]